MYRTSAVGFTTWSDEFDGREDTQPMNRLHQIIESKINGMKQRSEFTQALSDAGRLQDKLRAASYRRWFLTEHAELGLCDEDLSVRIRHETHNAYMPGTVLYCQYSVMPHSPVVDWSAYWSEVSQSWDRPDYRVGSLRFSTFLDAAIAAYKREEIDHVD